MKKRNFKLVCLMLAIMMAFSMTSMVWAVGDEAFIENERVVSDFINSLPIISEDELPEGVVPIELTERELMQFIDTIINGAESFVEFNIAQDSDSAIEALSSSRINHFTVRTNIDATFRIDYNVVYEYNLVNSGGVTMPNVTAISSHGWSMSGLTLGRSLTNPRSAFTFPNRHTISFIASVDYNLYLLVSGLIRLYTYNIRTSGDFNIITQRFYNHSHTIG